MSSAAARKAAAIRSAARLMRSDPFIGLRNAARASTAPQRGLRNELLTAALRRCSPAAAEPSVFVDVAKTIPSEVIAVLAPSGVRAVHETFSGASRQAAAKTRGTSAWLHRTHPRAGPLSPARDLRLGGRSHPLGVARDRCCPQGVLTGVGHQAGISRWDTGRVLAAAGSNPECPPVTLAAAAGVVSESLLTEHPNCPLALLAAFANSDRAYVRAHAARAERLPCRAARRLMSDPDEEVRSDLAVWTSYSDLLTELAEDHELLVRSGVATNPHTPASVLAGLARRDKGNVMMEDALEDNPAWPPPKPADAQTTNAEP